MKRLLGDPLVHFLVTGAVLFAALSLLGNEADPQQITVTAEQVRNTLRAQRLQRESEPTRAELESMLQPLIRDEVFYREAIALGLDVDDDQVRTRLIEKMRYLSEDLADPEPANEMQLRELFNADPSRFADPESVTFQHVFFSPSQRGSVVRQDAEAALKELRSGSDSSQYGDSTPLGEVFSLATRERLTILFGDQMTAALFALEPDVWAGPLESDFGLHLVRVDERFRTRQREFEDVREQVREAFAADRRAQRNAEAWAQMRERYEIVIEWPDE